MPAFIGLIFHCAHDIVIVQIEIFVCTIPAAAGVDAIIVTVDQSWLVGEKFELERGL